MLKNIIRRELFEDSSDDEFVFDRYCFEALILTTVRVILPKQVFHVKLFYIFYIKKQEDLDLMIPA